MLAGWHSGSFSGSYSSIYILIGQCFCPNGDAMFLMSPLAQKWSHFIIIWLSRNVLARYPITAEAIFFTSGKMFSKLILLVLSQMSGLESRIASGIRNKKYIRSHRNKRHGIKNVVNGTVIGLYDDGWRLHVWWAQHNV